MSQIIAEIGNSWRGRLAYAVESIRMAKEAGADVAKFQLFTPALWESGKVPEGMFVLPFGHLPLLRDVADEEGIGLLFSAFEPDVVRRLRAADDKAWLKLSSSAILYPELIDAAAGEFTTSVLMSCADGIAGGRALGACREHGWPPLFCEAEYPSPGCLFSLKAFIDRTRGLRLWGVSSHCINPRFAEAALVLGAEYVEVHVDFFGDEEPDHADNGHSLDEEELHRIVACRDYCRRGIAANEAATRKAVTPTLEGVRRG